MSLRHAILGFLEIEPTTGYTLLQRFHESVGSFWTATQSQIYRELHALELSGQLHVHIELQEGKPPRKVYTLTASGRKELRAWREGPLEPMQLRDPLQLRLVFSSEVDPDHLDALLKGYATSLEERRAEYRRRLESVEVSSLARSPRESAMWQLSIESGIDWCEAQLKWVARARRRLAPGAPEKGERKKRKGG